VVVVLVVQVMETVVLQTLTLEVVEAAAVK
jgi:hypothetical protein